MRLASSIGLDLIYHANNSRKKTIKHTTFPFCIKRKTGSKIVINWTQKFGHGMSYDDVLILETTLAIQHLKDQVHRSFSRAIIQPSKFVTFVWDNNNINPESLKGLSLHCTNGIVIEPSYVVINEPQPSSVDALVSSHSCKKHKTKKFEPLLTEIPSYVQVKRKNIEATTSIQLRMHTDEVKLSYIFDTLWIIARAQVNKTNFEQQADT